MGWFKKFKKKIRLPSKIRKKLKIPKKIKKLSFRKIKKSITARKTLKTLKKGLQFIPGGKQIEQGITKLEKAYDLKKELKKKKNIVATGKSRTSNVPQQKISTPKTDAKSNKNMLIMAATAVAGWFFLKD